MTSKRGASNRLLNILSLFIALSFLGVFFYLNGSPIGLIVFDNATNEIQITNETTTLIEGTINLPVQESQPELIVPKEDFSLNEPISFTFEFIQEASQNIPSETPPITGFAVVEPEKKFKKKWQDNNISIDTTILDVNKNPTSLEAELIFLRNGKFEIKISQPRRFKAGLYTLEINFTRNGQSTIIPQDFTWGVLAINTHKSIYLPNEKANIAIGVLDDQGHVVCNADLVLKIQDPSGSIKELTTKNSDIKISDECAYLGVTNLPDYYTYYDVSIPGTYLMNLTAVTYNGVKSILDIFEVRDYVDFDIERSGPTRVYPYVPYEMNLTIRPNKDYSGEVYEYVPKDFIITEKEDFKIVEEGEAKKLIWDVNLVNGEEYLLNYQFDAPDVSPEFYLLGKFTIDNFEEARFWQIANDAGTLTASAVSVNNTAIQVGQGIHVNISVSAAIPALSVGYFYTDLFENNTNRLNNKVLDDTPLYDKWKIESAGCFNESGAITVCAYNSANDFLNITLANPTGSTRAFNFVIQYNLTNNGVTISNFTCLPSSGSPDAITCGNVRSTNVFAVLPNFEEFRIKAGSGTTNTTNPVTVTFATPFPNSSYVVIATTLFEAADRAVPQYDTKASESFNLTNWDDAGGAEPNDFFWLTVPVGEFKINGTDIKAGYATTNSSNPVTVTFASAMPNTSYVILATAETRTTAVKIVSYDTKATTSFKLCADDDNSNGCADGAGDAAADISWLVLPLGEYSINGVLIKAGYATTNTTNAVKVTFTTAFANTLYSALATSQADSDTIIAQTNSSLAASITIKTETDADADIGADVSYLAIPFQESNLTNPDVKPPEIQLQYPANTTLTNSSIVSFVFNATDTNGNIVKNASLFTNQSGSWAISVSNSSTITEGTNHTLYFDLVSNGNYAWNIYACDNSTFPNCQFAASNWTVVINVAVVDNQAPSFSGITNGTNISQYQNNTFNVTITEKGGGSLSSYTFSWNGTGSGLTNDSAVTISGSTWNANTSKNISRRGGEVIRWLYYAQDNSSNRNQSTNEYYKVPADHYWNDSLVNIGTYDVNTGDKNKISYANFSWDSQQSATLTCSQGNCTVITANVSTFTAGAYYQYPIQFTCDTDLGIGYAETNYTLTTNFSSKSRQITANCTIRQDITAPHVQLQFPINRTIINSTLVGFIFNTTDISSDILNASLFTNLSGTWGRDADNNSVITEGSNYTIYFDLTSNGTYIWNVYVCDTLKNCNFSFRNETLIVNTNVIYFADTVILTNTTSILQNQAIRVNVNGTINSNSVNIFYPSNPVIYADLEFNKTTKILDNGCGGVSWNIENAACENGSVGFSFTCSFSSANDRWEITAQDVVGGQAIYDLNLTANVTGCSGGNYYFNCNESSGSPDPAYCNDVSGNVEVNVTDNQAPSFSNALNNTGIKRYFNISMNITITENGGGTLKNYTFSWNDSGAFVNDTPFQIGGSSTTWTANTSKNITGAVYNQIVQWRYYSCDNLNQCNTSATYNFTVANTVPPQPTNTAPANGSSTTNRTPLFVWTNDTEVDNQSVTWEFFYDDNIQFSSPSSKTGLTSNSTFPRDELSTDTTYYWYIRAYDGVGYSSNSTVFQVTINSLVSISLPNSTIEFGNMTNNEINDTTDQKPGPFVVQNDGNIFLDINLSGNQSLWVTQGLNTAYWRAKAANNTAEPGSFNFSNSTSSFANVPNTNKTFISELNYNDTKDSAITDIEVTVPVDEEPGGKWAGLIFEAYATT
ncbi:MAG: hypothetical protein HYS32_03205 [Candidatus Woesearchaeota archaeon]|nr:MAG: hypothetical protein HYS32_03205 [Candidatus Woesearchaeota archaeon]